MSGCEICGAQVQLGRKTCSRSHATALRNRIIAARARDDMQQPPPVPGATWIPLSDRTWALVDNSDAAMVQAHSWKTQMTSPRHAGVVCTQAGLLHRFILGLSVDDPEVDHENGDWRDNRRQNLRLATSHQNKTNSRKKSLTAPYKGVSLDKRDRRWSAYLTKDYKRRSLGRFASAEEAAMAYDAAAREAFGEFACVNFPRDGERSAL